MQGPGFILQKRLTQEPGASQPTHTSCLLTSAFWADCLEKMKSVLISSSFAFVHHELWLVSAVSISSHSQSLK